jgi:hypothetical protein
MPIEENVSLEQELEQFKAEKGKIRNIVGQIVGRFINRQRSNIFSSGY